MAQLYPSIKADEVIIDNCAMQLTSRPDQFDVMVAPVRLPALACEAHFVPVPGPHVCCLWRCSAVDVTAGAHPFVGQWLHLGMASLGT